MAKIAHDSETRPIEELDAKARHYVKVAVKSRKRAYAPYSKFRVGCVIVDEEGRLHSGCNVENVAYSPTLCAERVALGKMISRGGTRIHTVVVITTSEEPAFPCGVCRQALIEFNAHTRVLAVNSRGSIYREATLDALLPFAFLKSALGRKI